MASLAPDEVDDQRNISGNVYVLMFRHDLNQQQFGDRVGIKQNNLSGRLLGQIRWTIRDLRRLEAEFGLTMKEAVAHPKDNWPGALEPVWTRPSYGEANRHVNTRQLNSNTWQLSGCAA